MQLTKLAPVPAIVLVVSIAATLIFGSSEIFVFNPPYLLLVLNVIFWTGATVAIVYVSAKTFLHDGSLAVLLIGTSILLLGLALIIAGWAGTFSGNYSVTIGNLCPLVASIVQLVSSLFSFVGKEEPEIKRRRISLSVAYVGATVFVGFVTVLVLSGSLPPFFTASGPTFLRQVVLGSTVLFFGAAFLVFGMQYAVSRSSTLLWYAFAIGLFSVGFFSAFEVKGLGDVPTWLGRTALYVGNIYLLVALFRSHAVGAGISSGWAEAFRSDRRQIETLFSKMLNGFSYHRIVVDKNGKPVDCVFLAVNEAFEKMTGLRRDDVIGKRVTEVLPGVEKDPANWISIYGKVALTGQPASFENYAESLKKWYSVSAYSPRRGYFVVIFEDVTERKKAERELEEANRNLERIVEERTEKLAISAKYARNLLEASLDPLVTISAEGKITDVNDATELVTGFSRNQLIGSDFSNYFTEPEKAQAGYRQVFADGFVRDYPLAIRHKSGKITHVLYNATVYRNDKGEVQGIFAAARDITERKTAEERYRMLFDSIDEGFCIIEMIFDPDLRPIDYRFLEVNASFERQTGLQDAQGKLMRSLAPNHEAYWFDIYGEIALTGKPRRFTNEARALNRWYDVYAFPVGEGKIRKVGTLFNDITQRKNLERQLQDKERMATIGATAGMVGHDIRNPLQAIVSDVYLAKGDLASVPESEARENVMESLVGIEKNVEYIDKIVLDLQDYARSLNPIAKKIDLGGLCDDVLLKSSMPKNIKSSCAVDENAKQIIADPELLRRIVSNLVTNAVQAMPKGGRLDIRAYRQQADFVIEIQDTGVGIPDDVKPKLFTPLFTTKSKGQGFGLAVVKRVTESMNGTVTFESEEGKGTKFMVRLPSLRRDER